uniref:Coiled-coil domain containing 125 n=1 Tax=Nothoprocta perdicaria TaxID=30464 RepID=A0A8C7A3R5_NOTPE
MLDVKQQKVIQENMSWNKSGLTDITGLELAVLGACTCSTSGGQPCSCARMSAATRKQLLQLKQEETRKAWGRNYQVCCLQVWTVGELKSWTILMKSLRC